MAVTINWETKVIDIPKADLTLVQTTPSEVYELDIDWFRLQLKDIEDNVEGQPFSDTHRHNTQVRLGGLTFARVIEILEPYTVTFEDGQYAVNLIGANSNIGDRVNLNQVSVRSYNSAGLVGVSTIEREVLKSHRLIESLRPHHKSTGDIYYWDPVGGDDTRDGTIPTNAVKTFSKAHSLALDGNHDIIMCMPTPSVVAQNFTDPIQITKSWLFLRGPGFDFKFKPTSLINGAGIDVQANGVQLEGIRVDMADAGVGAIGVKSDGSEFHLKNVIIENASAQGLYSVNANREHLEDFFIGYCGTHGIEFGDNCEHVTISNGQLDSNGISGINISGTGCDEIVVRNGTLLQGNGECGLKVGTGVTSTHIYADVVFRDNVVCEISDNGVGTIDERERVVARIWDKLAADHTTAGTMGKALSDAGASGNPWGAPVSGNTGPGTFGELVGKRMLTVAKFLGLK